MTSTPTRPVDNVVIATGQKQQLFDGNVFCTDGKISVRNNLPLFSTVLPSKSCCFCPVVTSTPTRPVENVVLTTKDLQDRNIHLLDGTKVENKGKKSINSNF